MTPKHLDDIVKLAEIERRSWKSRLNALVLSGDPVAAFLKTRVGTFYDKEILKYVTGIEATRNIVIDGTTVPVDSSSGRYVLQAGTLMVSNAGQSAQSTIQQVSVPSDATSGSYQLIVPAGATPGGAGGPGVTAPLAFGHSAADLQNALAALPDIGGGNVTVTEAAGNPATPTPNVFTVTFVGALLGGVIPQLQVINSTVNGTGAVTTAVTQAGQASIATAKAAPAASSGVSAGNILGILTHTVEFFYPPEPNVTDEPAATYFHLCVFDSTKLINVSGNLAAAKAAMPTCLFQ